MRAQEVIKIPDITEMPESEKEQLLNTLLERALESWLESQDHLCGLFNNRHPDALKRVSAERWGTVAMAFHPHRILAL